MKEGFYLVSFTGHADSGYAVMVLDSGYVCGADVGGCEYDGTYKSNDETGIVDANITLTIPPGLALVTGFPSQSEELKLKFSVSFNSETPGKFFPVETPTGPVNALIKFLRHRRRFPDEIGEISKDFLKIYKQAEGAEDSRFDEICGPGYRKALEYLIKDYCIQKNPDDSEAIKKSFLGNVIDSYISDPQIKNNAKRAAWLGNDETHFERKWNDKDIDDLKTLIQLTVNFIHSDWLTDKYKREMPSKEGTGN